MKAPLDLDELEARIEEKAAKGIHVAPVVKQLIAELRAARAEVHNERDAAVSWLEGLAFEWLEISTTTERALRDAANTLARGDHRREER